MFVEHLLGSVGQAVFWAQGDAVNKADVVPSLMETTLCCQETDLRQEHL